MWWRTLVAAALGAVAMMLAGSLYWVVLDAPGAQLLAAPDEEALGRALRAALPESGTYLLPLQPTQFGRSGEGAQSAEPAGAMAAFEKRHRDGPLAMIHFVRDGREPLAPSVLLLGLLQYFLTCLLAAAVMAPALSTLDSYSRRVGFLFMLGLFAAVALRLSDPIWWNLPWEHQVHQAALFPVIWLAAALVLAGVLYPKRGYTHLTDTSKPVWRRALDVD